MKSTVIQSTIITMVTIFEITLVYSPFLAIPYLLGLIKREEIEVINNTEKEI